MLTTHDLLALAVQAGPSARDRTVLGITLAGALVFDLMGRGCLEYDGEQGVRVTRTDPTGQGILDGALRHLMEGEMLPAEALIVRLSRPAARHVRHVLGDSHGCADDPSGRLEHDAAYALALRDRLLSLLDGDETPRPREIVLLSLARLAGVLLDSLPPEGREKRLSAARIMGLHDPIVLGVASVLAERLRGVPVESAI